MGPGYEDISHSSPKIPTFPKERVFFVMYLLAQINVQHFKKSEQIQHYADIGALNDTITLNENFSNNRIINVILIYFLAFL